MVYREGEGRQGKVQRPLYRGTTSKASHEYRHPPTSSAAIQDTAADMWKRVIAAAYFITLAKLLFAP